MNRLLNSTQIKSEARRLGFYVCGIAPAQAVDTRQADAFRNWIATGKQAGMTYMANHSDLRLDPRQLTEGTQSIISVALNYYPAHHIPEQEPQIACYAYGKDYHDVLKELLRKLEAFIAEQAGPNLITRICCDTAPLLERYWAWKAGLGWIGKNTQLIIPKAGSHFFLGEILVGREADQYDHPIPSRCGNCTRCIDACPGKALEAPYRLNAGTCLSYLTIEHRGDFPAAERPKTGNRIYGCDTCQQVCPWNRFATPTHIDAFAPSEQLLNMRREDWANLTEEKYRSLFRGSAVKRAKYAGLCRNIAAMLQDTCSPLLRPEQPEKNEKP